MEWLSRLFERITRHQLGALIITALTLFIASLGVMVDLSLVLDAPPILAFVVKALALTLGGITFLLVLGYIASILSTNAVSRTLEQRPATQWQIQAGTYSWKILDTLGAKAKRSKEVTGWCRGDEVCVYRELSSGECDVDALKASYEFIERVRGHDANGVYEEKEFVCRERIFREYGSQHVNHRTGHNRKKLAIITPLSRLYYMGEPFSFLSSSELVDAFTTTNESVGVPVIHDYTGGDLSIRVEFPRAARIDADSVVGVTRDSRTGKKVRPDEPLAEEMSDPSVKQFRHIVTEPSPGLHIGIEWTWHPH